MEVLNMPKVAVEGALTPVAQMLQQNGYDVVQLNENELNQVDCVVISGGDQNVMGMEDRATKAQIVNAEGLTAEQVVREVEQRMNKR
jgi:glutamine amidotransferase PdxT